MNAHTETVAPTYSLDDLRKAASDCINLCGREFASKILIRYGCASINTVPPNRRWLLISAFNLETKKHVEELRKKSFGPDPVQQAKGVNVTVNINAPLVNNSSSVSRQIEIMSGNKDERSRRLRRGPFAMTPGTLRFGSHVETTDGRKGRVASICVKEGTCTRLVLVLDDCTTRIYEGIVNGFQIYSVDGARKKYASGGYAAQTYKLPESQMARYRNSAPLHHPV